MCCVAFPYGFLTHHIATLDHVERVAHITLANDNVARLVLNNVHDAGKLVKLVGAEGLEEGHHLERGSVGSQVVRLGVGNHVAEGDTVQGPDQARPGRLHCGCAWAVEEERLLAKAGSGAARRHLANLVNENVKHALLHNVKVVALFSCIAFVVHTNPVSEAAADTHERRR